ncbi:MAG: extracellular solute-binding protein [bacterium]|nr:extracellular solute-binding protein [bacterium]
MDLPPQPTPIQPQVVATPFPVVATSPNLVELPKKSPWKIILVVVLLLAVLGGGAYLALNVFGLGKPKPTGPTTLTWWGLWEDESVIRPLITEYEAAHPDVKINYIFQSQREYRERLQNALSQGSGPDIFRIHNTWVPMFKTDLAPIPADIYSAQTFESTFYPTAKTDLRLGNNYVAIPLEYDGLGMYVNEELLSQAGASVPQSWTELRETAAALCVGDTEDGKCRSGERVLIAGVAMGTIENVDHWQDIVATLMLQNNVNLNAPSGKPAEDVLDFYTVFSRTDGVWNSSLPNSTAAFAGGKLAIYFGPSWRAHDILAANPSLKFKVYPVPQLPIDPALGEKPITWASYWAEAVNAKSPHTKQAWDFVGWLSQRENLQKFYQGAVASGRAFGEPYSRVDMASLVTSDPYVGAYINQALNAKSWYLASFTWDGPTGINSRISQYFADALNGINQGKSASESIKTLTAGINQVLSQYGLAAQAPAAQ